MQTFKRLFLAGCIACCTATVAGMPVAQAKKAPKCDAEGKSCHKGKDCKAENCKKPDEAPANPAPADPAPAPAPAPADPAPAPAPQQ